MPPAFSPPAVAARGRIASLQACRAMAACLVVLSHNSESIFSKTKYWPANPVGHLLDPGYIGVQFFFVLSGFIILTVHRGDIGRPDRAARFVRRRVVRIYPVYWVVLAALLAVFFAVPSFGEGFERAPDMILSSVLLVGGWHLSDTLKPVTILAAAWTLYYEVAFYAVFLLLILRRRLGIAALAAWFAVSAAGIVAGPWPGAAGLYLSPYNLLFLIGMAAALAVARGPVPMPALFAGGGLVVFFAGGADAAVGPGLLDDTSRSLICGLGSAAALVGLVELERSRGLRVPRWLVMLGEASYAIYLVHLAVLVLLAKVVSRLTWRGTVPPGGWYAGFAVVAVLAGVGFHLVVERPLLAACSKARALPWTR